MNDVAAGPRSRRSAKAVSALIMSICACIASPLLIFLAYIAVIWWASSTSEESNSLLDHLIPLAVFILLVALATVIPLAAVVTGTRALRDIRSSPVNPSGASMVMASRILAGAAIAVVIVGLAFYGLSLAGVCSLSGCG